MRRMWLRARLKISLANSSWALSWARCLQAKPQLGQTCSAVTKVFLKIFIKSLRSIIIDDLSRSNHTKWSYHLSKWKDWLEQPELWEALPHTVSMSKAITWSQDKNLLKDHQYYLGSLLCSFPKHLVKYQLPHHQPSPPYLVCCKSTEKKIDATRPVFSASTTQLWSGSTPSNSRLWRAISTLTWFWTIMGIFEIRVFE